MESEVSNCANCSSSFEIFPEDRDFYSRVRVPFPSWCPACRHLRRHAFINDYVYFSRSCDCCRKGFVSIYPANSPYIIFCQNCWFSEDRDDKASGRDFDFSRPFFEQFDQLMHESPQLGIIGMNNQNSEYSESVANCKNVYLISESSNCEDCSYCYWIQKSLSCFDCAYLHECEHCYEVIDSVSCQRLHYSQNCSNCSDSYFLDNCKSCTNCAFSSNLRHKEFHLFNQAYSKEEYFKRLAEIPLDTPAAIKAQKERFDTFLAEQPRKHLQIENTENCSGDYIRNAKNCRNVFHCYEAEECAYGEHIWRGAKYCFDSNSAGRNAELSYECTNSGIESYNVKFCRYCWGCSNTEYSNQCKNGNHLFGCVSLKPKASYCILNKQYSPEDYQKLATHIREHMKETKEYGEFFPPAISPFGYNTSISFDEQPLSREEVLKKGWKWEEQQSGTFNTPSLALENLPKNTQEAKENLCQETLACRNCQRNYRIARHELNFYQSHKLPLPESCPSCRQTNRLRRRNSKTLHQINCSSCQKDIQSTLNPAKFSKILCTNCYKRQVYG